jgi:hypothetical protein
MTSSDQQDLLLRLTRAAERVREAIGVTWFGPDAGRYYITDAAGELIETGLDLQLLQQRYDRRLLAHLDEAMSAIPGNAA